ncbi:peroxide stress protein YaaA [Crateriforma spongiae]|uniref:peroxide stress protein YaaA n=1 Tax=Crateriforma spongiae TaxID=2724528 RepID=UPI0039B05B07
MLSILSPSKTLDFDSPVSVTGTTKIPFPDDSQQLASQLAETTPNALRDLMGISESLAELNHQRFQDWEIPSARNGGRPAACAFQGDVYRGLKTDQWTSKQWDYAQDHLRILSGLYGVLRPKDLMLPYRLEMGTSLKTDRGKDLYAFWGDKVRDRLIESMEEAGAKFLLNLASQEYLKVIGPKTFPFPIITPVFKENKDGKYKMITVFAKVARGTMASWAIRKKAKTPKKLQTFDADGYRYDAASSKENQPVFLRG